MSQEEIKTQIDRERLKEFKKQWYIYGGTEGLFEIGGGPEPTGSIDSMSDTQSKKDAVKREIDVMEAGLSEEEKIAIDNEVKKELTH
mgnify:CR=1 FL=1